MKLIPILAIAVLTISTAVRAQSRAEVFSGKDVASQLETLMQSAKTSGSGGTTLGDYNSHAIKLSVRTASGGAEVHAYQDDIFVVVQGKATLITGGNLVNAKSRNDGETTGDSIQDGMSQTIIKGDIVHVPAGMPHQLIVAPTDGYSAIVIKVKEAEKLP
jgi:mannose-6-phosphate isomerase-like protein (cupin superfamily)